MEIRKYEVLLYVLACAIHNVVPDVEILSGSTSEEIYVLAKQHSLLALTGYGLKPLIINKFDGDVKKKSEAIDWNQEVAYAQRRMVLMDTEREQILQYMENEGIWYMPLKGVFLKDLYPDYGLREMSDNDILYNHSFREKLISYMLDRGYKIVSNDSDKDDVFFKSPIYNFEFHRDLFEKDRQILYNYYKDVNKRLIRDQEKKYGYHFSEEDFYIYYIAHAYKHFYIGGTGIRSLIDEYLYLKNKSLDWNYLENEFMKLGMRRFETTFRRMSYKLFDKPERLTLNSFSQDDFKFLEYILFSGTYGNKTNKTINRIRDLVPGEITRLSIVRFAFYRLFPCKEWLKIHEPEIYNHKNRVAFYYLGRIVRAVRKAPSVIDEFKIAFVQKGRDNKRPW